MLELPSNFERPLEQEITESIALWQGEVKQLLPTLPDQINYEFEENTDGKGYGTTGVTLTPDRIRFGIDTSADIDHQELIREFKGTFYHENFHVARGYNMETTKGLSLLEHAIEEGFATKFEMIHVGTKPGYGVYEAFYTRDEMVEMFKEVSNLTDEDNKDWEKWKFYHPEKDRKWILYRVGVFVADEVLTNNPDLKIEDLATLSSSEILSLSKLV